MPTSKVSKAKKVKGGKLHRDGKADSKADKESEVEKAKAAAGLWELKLRVLSESVTEYRRAYRTLSASSQAVSGQLVRAEQDQLQLTGYWSSQLERRDHQIQMLEENLRSQEELACDERSKLTRELNMAQHQVKKMKEMEEMMEVEIVDLKESKAVAHEEHKDNQDKMEKKHFEEKALLEERMSQICKEKLAIRENLHQEATKQFEAKIQTSLQEQHRLLDVIEKYKKDVHDLKHLKYSLADENAALKDKIRSMVKQNATRMEAQKAKLAELKAIIASLEQILELNNVKLEQQQETLKVNQVTIQASQVELEKLQLVLSLREKELAQIKKQAMVIIKHRRELENFFDQALAHVKQEISTSKAQYKKEAQRDYHLKFREATAGKIKFPPVRTFHRSSHSTNCVYSDMEAAEPWPYPPGSEVEFSHLTWEQKEKVLKLLFAKMNTAASWRPCGHLCLAASSEKKSLADSTAATV